MGRRQADRSAGGFAGSLALVVILLAAGTSLRADPLDKVTGTEDWSARRVESVSQEWRDWYRARIGWRQGVRELMLQRFKNRRLAQLLRRRGEVGPKEVRDLLRLTRPQAVSPAAQPTRRSGGATDELPAGGDQAPDPPDWIRVPVERLDADGQAIDEEGDRALRRSLKKKKARGRGD